MPVFLSDLLLLPFHPPLCTITGLFPLYFTPIKLVPALQTSSEAHSSEMFLPRNTFLVYSFVGLSLRLLLKCKTQDLPHCSHSFSHTASHTMGSQLIHIEWMDGWSWLIPLIDTLIWVGTPTSGCLGTSFSSWRARILLSLHFFLMLYRCNIKDTLKIWKGNP